MITCGEIPHFGKPRGLLGSALGPFPGARNAPGSTPGASPEGPSADPRIPRGAHRLYVYVIVCPTRNQVRARDQ
eukprot:7369353-Pyramimonas_sp.AAC.1